MTSIAILQSNYIPWRGYFDLLQAVDEFVLLDTVQFTKNDWRNRNRIQTAAGPHWLTIPIRTAGRAGQRIADAEVAAAGWAHGHWRTISQTYARAPGWKRYGGELESLYDRAAGQTHLSVINRMFLDAACAWLRIPTRVTNSAEYPDHPDRIERLIGICREAGARRYVSGPRAQAYLDCGRFAAAGIDVRFHDYAADEPRFSIIDTILRS